VPDGGAAKTWEADALGVPDGSCDPVDGRLVHDDLVISAALCAVLENERWDTAESFVLPAPDPMTGQGEVV